MKSTPKEPLVERLKMTGPKENFEVLRPPLTIKGEATEILRENGEIDWARPKRKRGRETQLRRVWRREKQRGERKN